MTNLIYLIPVDHGYQHKHPGYNHPYKIKRISEFQEYIKNTVNDYKIDLIAEEWSTEASKRNFVCNSTVYEIAKIINIEHIYCDPTSQERTDHNINDDYRKRELFWLSRIKAVCQNNNRKILFIFGGSHSESILSVFNSDSTFYAQIISDNEFMEDVSKTI